MQSGKQNLNILVLLIDYSFMIYRLYSSDARRLSSLPESGMGYQIVQAKEYFSNSAKEFVIYNSELAIDLNENFSYEKELISKSSFKNILNSSKELYLEESSIKILNKTELSNLKYLIPVHKIYNKRHSGGKDAKLGPKENANGKEVFVRISAYENDIRIDDINKKLKPGSYSTTEEDYKDCVNTKDDPIDRYALPNNEEIKWAFYIKPDLNDILQRGVVQAAFGHSGGGIEVYFENGTSNNTYFAKRSYGL
jgi:hypothetical protein